MSAYSQAQQAIAERFTPELKRHAARFALSSIGIGLLAALMLMFLHATYEPFVWTVLVCTGVFYGWFAHTEAMSPRVVEGEEEDD